jgi:hypothetical protein
VGGVLSEKEYDVAVERDLEKVKQLVEQGYEYVCDVEGEHGILKVFRKSTRVGERAVHGGGASAGRTK